MVSHVFAALTKKRTDLAGKEKGFTLIELLVTVIIIGVLAAIAIPVYLNVQGGAKDSAVQSDLTSAKTTIATFQTSGSTKFPVDLAAVTEFKQPAAENYQGAPATPLVYSVNTARDKFCMTGISASGKSFAIDEKSSATEGQTCTTGVMGTYTAP